MEVSLDSDALKGTLVAALTSAIVAACALDALAKFSAFLTVKLHSSGIEMYSLNASLSSYGSVRLSRDIFEAFKLVDCTVLSSAFKSLLSLLRTKKMCSPVQLIFSQSHIVALLKTHPEVEKIYKLPFEEVQFVQVEHPDTHTYPSSVCVLTRTLWSALAPHTLLSGKQNELLLEFSPGGVKVCSKETTRIVTSVSCSDFYQYQLASAACFTLIRSELLGIVSAVEGTESLVRLSFGLHSAPVLIAVEGVGEGIGLAFIMSTMVEDDLAVTEVVESEHEEQDRDESGDGDEFAIPGTPEYVY